ncbi:MAG: hypothetical protein IPG45_32370 [Deltaproteobacteria bacterium]|jgi:hypothetical protein|nr:hypothetical protein [Deltaproteobacteria bacterium]
MSAAFSEHSLRPAIAAGLVEMIIPDKANSRLQRYRTTDAGKARLAKTRGGAELIDRLLVARIQQAEPALDDAE